MLNIESIDKTFDEGILIENVEYNMGTNDGKEFDRAIFKGYKMHHGKKMMCFSTNKLKALILNPSYVCWYLECDDQKLDIDTYEEATLAWESRIGERE